MRMTFANILPWMPKIGDPHPKSAQIVVSGVMRVILTISIVVWVVQLCTNPTRFLKGARYGADNLLKF